MSIEKLSKNYWLQLIKNTFSAPNKTLLKARNLKEAQKSSQKHLIDLNYPDQNLETKILDIVSIKNLVDGYASQFWSVRDVTLGKLILTKSLLKKS